MEFTINFDDSKIISVDKIYKGSLKNGQKFEIHANWNDWDGWSVDDVVLESDTEESVKEEISESFMKEMNGYIE
jgi:hypothetical protein